MGFGPGATVPGVSGTDFATEQTARATGDTTVTANTQTGDYTLVLGDAGKCVRMNKATAQILTIPTNANVAFPTGTIISIRRVGAGSVTIAGDTGVTHPNRVEAAGTTDRTIANQYGEATIHKTDTNVWELVGDIA